MISCADSENVDLAALEAAENLFGISTELIPRDICNTIRDCDTGSYSLEAMAVETAIMDQICPAASTETCGCGNLCNEDVIDNVLSGEDVNGDAISCPIQGFFWSREAFSSVEGTSSLTEQDFTDSLSCRLRLMRAAMCQDGEIICFN